MLKQDAASVPVAASIKIIENAAAIKLSAVRPLYHAVLKCIAKGKTNREQFFQVLLPKDIQSPF